MKKRGIICFTVSLAVVCLLWGSGFAVKPPELGTYIGPDNIDKYLEYIPCRGIIDAIRKGDKVIVAEKPYYIGLPDYYKKATAKYGPRTKLTEDGGLSMYMGGLPFTQDEIDSEPDAAKKALLVAWNMTMRWLGDDMTTHYLPDAQFTIGDASEDMKHRMCRRICGNKYGKGIISDQRIDTSTASGRLLKPPIPAMKGREHMYKVRHYTIVNPRDVAGQQVLYYEYLDPNKNDDLWIFIPSIKRVKRMPTSQRSATRAPTDTTWDDGAGWSGKTVGFNWNILEERQVLALQAHTGDDRQHRKGVTLPNPIDLLFALADVYVVEHTPKDPAYGIAKRHFFIAKGGYQVFYVRTFNRRGELWRSNAQVVRNVASKELGEEGSVAGGFLVWDHLRDHYTFLYAPVGSVNGYMDPHIYTIKFLYSGMRGMR